MTFNELMKSTLATWFAPKVESPNVEVVNAEVATEATIAEPNTEEVAPVAMNAEPNPMEARIGDLEQMVKGIIEKLNTEPIAMSAINALKDEVVNAKAEIAKLSAKPEGEVISPEKKKTVKVETEHAALKKLLA